MSTPGEQSAPSWKSRMADRVEGLLEDARAARQAGDGRTARSLLEAVIALDPGNAEAQVLLAGPASRRQMTLLFCDIIGSTEIADSRDPEEVTALLSRYRSICAEVVDELDGYIDDHRGDGMLVLFGYPEVNEDDARRGVLCGLRMIDRIQRRLRSRPEDLEARVHVRISVHTDLVVIGDGIAGAAANEASRLQELAPPDTVVISDATHALVWPWFETRSEGSRTLRGVSRPIELFTVVRELAVHRGRRAGRPPTPFVNRVPELKALEWLHPLPDPRSGDAGSDTAGLRAVFLSGPGGIGKTRLAAEAARGLNLRLLECPCSRLHNNISLHPLRSLLEETCGVTEDDDPPARLGKLRAALARVGQSEEDLPFLAAALDIPLSLLSPPADVQPDLLRQRALLAVAGLLQATAAAEGGLIFIDDLQWADQSTLDLLTIMFAAPGPPVILTAREGFEPPWPETVVRRLRIDPLGTAEVTRLVQQASTREPLTEERVRELVERSDGVPLFAEELLQTAEAVTGDRPVRRAMRFSAYQIPPALLDPLLARLDRPEVDLELAQLASVVGREVDRDLLRRVSRDDAQRFDARLRSLLDAGLIELYGAGVRFRHELIREVAYETQRRTLLQERHGRVADALLADAEVDNRRWSDEAAFHLERAGRLGEAVATHLQIAAADQAVGAHAEAARRLTAVLGLLERLPAGEERSRTELLVRELRSFSAVLTGGYAAPEAAEDYPRCLELCETTITDADVLPYLVRSWSFYAFRGDLDRAESVYERASQRAAAAGIPNPAQHACEGIVKFLRGEFGPASEQLRMFVDDPWANTPGAPPPGWTLPNDPLAATYAHLGPALWILGRPAESLAACAAGLARAESLAYPHGPFSQLYVNCLQALTHNVDGDWGAALAVGSRLVGAAEQHGFAMWRLAGALQCLLAAVHLGDHTQLPQLVETAAVWHQLLAADAWTPYWLSAVGLAQQSAGRLADARASFDQALAVAEDTGSHLYTAETLRGRGEVRLGLGDPGGAADLDQALSTARRQGARLFADRATAARQRLLDPPPG